MARTALKAFLVLTFVGISIRGCQHVQKAIKSQEKLANIPTVRLEPIPVTIGVKPCSTDEVLPDIIIAE